MGRQLYRVPLDFDWPIETTWEGFLNHLPDGDNCPACRSARDPSHSNGYSPFAQAEYGKWYGFNGEFDPVAEGKADMMFTAESAPIRAFAERQVSQSPEFYGRGEAAIQREAERLAALMNTRGYCFLDQDDVNALINEHRLSGFGCWDLVKPEGSETYVHVRTDRPYPTYQQVNDWSAGPGMGHDGINQWIVLKSRCERAGVPYTCETCDGSGTIWPSQEMKDAYENWEPTPPPEGPGWQMWQTVSEGSPISPVFETPEALARHMSHTRWGADSGSSYATWMKFIMGDGWAPSGMSNAAGELVSGVEGIAGPSDPDEITPEPTIQIARTGDVLDAIFEGLGR